MKSVGRLILTATLLHVGASAIAGRYELLEGKGVQVCEAYELNLNASKPNPITMARVCPLPIDTKFPDFRQPQWKGRYDTPMPVPPGVDLYSKIDQFLWQRDANPARYVLVTEWSKWQGTAEQRQSAWKAFQARRENFYSVPSNLATYAVLDIDNDGVPEPVYHDNHNCHYSGFASMLIVLNEDYTDIDRIKTERVLMHPPRKKGAAAFRPLKPGETGLLVGGKHLDFAIVPDAISSAYYGVFQYQTKAYVYFWGFVPEGSQVRHDVLRVYLVEKDQKRELCTYRFRN